MWQWEKAVTLNLSKFVTGYAYGLIDIGDLAYTPEATPEEIGRTIFESLAKENFRYTSEPFSSQQQIQKVRNPFEIFTAKEGTCLDLSLLYAGLCLDYQLLPVLVVLEGHIFVAISSQFRIGEWDSYSRQEKQIFINAVCEEYGSFREFVLNGSFFVVECTGFAKAKNIKTSLPEGNFRDGEGFMSFDGAKSSAQCNFKESSREFQFAIDLAQAKRGCLISTEVIESQKSEASEKLKKKYQVAGKFLRDKFLACPYPGIAPIDALGQAGRNVLYCGRKKDLEKLLKNVSTKQISIVIGPSGSGKSSLVLGGLVGRLQELNQNWKVHCFRPSINSLIELKTLLGIDNAADRLATTKELANHLSLTDHDFLLIVVDQLEEFLSKRDRADCNELIELLQQLVKTQLCSVVITARADYYEDLLQLNQWKQLSGEEKRIELAELSRQELKELIVEPANAVGVEVDDALVSLLQEDTSGEPGHLPFLQETLVYIWGLMRPTDLRLRLEAYEGICAWTNGKRSNGLEASIESNAIRVYESVPNELKPLVPLIFLYLIQLVPGRPPVRKQRQYLELLSIIGNKPAHEAVIEKLVEGRLLTKSGKEYEKATIDIAHDALLTGWARLKDWIVQFEDEKSSFDWLQTKVDYWIKTGKQNTGLLKSDDLSRAIKWRQGSMASLGFVSPEIDEVLTTSNNLAKRDWLILTGMAIAAVLLVICVLVMQNTISGQKAEDRIQEICNQVESLAKNSPERGMTALLLAIHAYNLKPCQSTYEALVSAMTLVPYNRSIGKFEAVERVVFSPTYDFVLVAQPNQIEVVEIPSARKVKALSENGIDPKSLTISNDGKWIAYSVGEGIFCESSGAFLKKRLISAHGSLLGIFSDSAGMDCICFIANEEPNKIRVCELKNGSLDATGVLIVPRPIDLKKEKIGFDMSKQKVLLSAGPNLYSWTYKAGTTSKVLVSANILVPQTMTWEKMEPNGGYPLPPPSALPPPPLPGEVETTEIVPPMVPKPFRNLLPPKWIEVDAATMKAFVSYDGHGLEVIRLLPDGKTELLDRFFGTGQAIIEALDKHNKLVYLSPFPYAGELASFDLKRQATRLSEMRASSGLWLSPRGDYVCICKDNELRIWSLKGGVQSTREVSVKSISSDGKLVVVGSEKSNDAIFNLSNQFGLRLGKFLDTSKHRYFFSPGARWLTDGQTTWSVVGASGDSYSALRISRPLTIHSMFSKDDKYSFYQLPGDSRNLGLVDLQKYFESEEWNSGYMSKQSFWGVPLPDADFDASILNEMTNSLVIKKVIEDSKELKQKDTEPGVAFTAGIVRAEMYEICGNKAVRKCEYPHNMPAGYLVGLSGDWCLVFGSNEKVLGPKVTRKLLAFNLRTGKCFELPREKDAEWPYLLDIQGNLSSIPVFSKSGLFVAYVKSADGRTIGYFDLEAGRDSTIPLSAGARAIKFSNDGRFLLVSLNSGVLNIFQIVPDALPVSAGASAPQLRGTLIFNSPVDHLAFSDDDKSLICGSKMELSKTVWRPVDVLKEAESRADRKLSNSEVIEFSVNEIKTDPRNKAVDLSKSLQPFPSFE